jgi:hypothetical protein
VRYRGYVYGLPNSGYSEGQPLTGRRRRGAGTTRGGLASMPTKTSREFAMLVPFAPITSEGTWIEPVILLSV